jgi:hypothetical protein
VSEVEVELRGDVAEITVADGDLTLIVRVTDETYEISVASEALTEGSSAILGSLTADPPATAVVVVGSNGELDIQFSNGLRLAAGTLYDVEAWEIVGARLGILAVGLPGGGVAVWSGESNVRPLLP